MASLDHAMWFHRPFRADDWLLYAMQSPNAGRARGLAYGKIFTRDGVLVAVAEAKTRVSYDYATIAQVLNTTSTNVGAMLSRALDRLNDALEPGAGFEVDTNRVALLGRDGAARILPLQSKREVAEAILDAVERSLG